MYDRPVGEGQGRSRDNRIQRNEGRVWLIAWALTLVLHLAAFLIFQSVPSGPAVAVVNRRPQPIQLTFARPAPETPADTQPRFFSELPPDRADEAPEKAQFLSNVTSRARDRIPGGTTDLPRMEGESDAPTVKLEAESRPSPPPAAGSSAPEDAPDPSPGNDGPGDAGTATTAGKPQRSRLVGLSNDQAFRGPGGTSGIDQPEMSNLDGNASILGDVSLNTVEWDYAPWLQRFAIELRERWYPPTAYRMGMLKEGGWAMFEAEISKSGRLLRLDSMEEQGHPSLTLSARSALRSMSIERLPADFPEPTLILRIRMIYPKIRTR